MSLPLPPAIDAQEWQLDLPGSGACLCYRDVGSAAGTDSRLPVLLLHSINAAPSAREVRPLFEALRGERAVFAPDLPGFGRSNRADRVYSPAFYAGVVRDLVEAIRADTGAPGVHLLALSTTSEFAALAANAGGEGIASLVAVSPTGLGRRQPPGGPWGDRIHRFLRLPSVGTGLFRLLRSRRSVRYFLGMAFDGEAPAELVDYACLTAAQPGAEHAPFHFLAGKLFTRQAIDAIYRELAVPGLVLYDQDPNVGFERLDELLRGNSRWRAERISGTRGLPHYQRPDETLRALRTLWAECERECESK